MEEAAMNIPYVQCELRNGDRVLTTWVPRKWAQKGKELRVREARRNTAREEGSFCSFPDHDDSLWEAGWIVDMVHNGNVLTGTDLDTIRDEYRFHRRRTDV